MKKNESGSTIILSMIVIIVLATCVAGALDYTLQTFRDTQQSNAEQQAVTAATGALDLAFVQFREACRLQENQDLTASAITSGSAWSPITSYSSLTGASAVAGSAMNIPGISNPITVTLNALDATNPNGVAQPLTSGSAIPSQAQSLTMCTWSYLAKATASYQSLKGTQTVTVSRIFQKQTMSPWQYAIFYNNDLEINPGATMNVTGAVQTNGSLYTGGSDGTNHLNFDGAVNYAGSWNPNGAFAPSDTANNGETPVPPTGTTPSAGPEQLPENSTLLSTASTNPNLSDGYHEIIEPPVSGYTDPLAGTATAPSERYYNQAGVKIMITGASRSNPTVSIYDAGGTLLTGGTSQTTTQRAIYTAFHSAITTNSTLQDARQNATINLTTLNISSIVTALNTTLYGDGCNIVYIDDQTANPAGGVNCGVELINGYNMPSGGLTVVSDNPVYILGDYNTAASSSDIPSNVPSDRSTSNPAQPYDANDYTPQPCAVMADAVTILSNSWTNANSTRSLSSRVASNTTVNTAILSGIVTSGSGFVFTGGVENFLRLLENWSGKYLTYYGSLVELFNSTQGTGVYQEPGAYYEVPTRQWYFNVAFYSQPPPGTFEVITYTKSRWFVN
jgi:hypothetical protein